MATPVAPVSTTATKSGIRNLKPGEILFNDGDSAESLFIIQKGQVRLFKPKGKGFIEIAVLRSSEVIGEMAFFDEDGSGKKRSCSASAITPVEIIEISFTAFGKTMSSLNPWFKTIINTLATRLRKTNTRVKELEDNQASVSYGTKQSTYEFLKSIEVMRILGTLFLVFKAHGEVKDQALVLNRKALTLYTSDMYQIQDVKLESIINILSTLGWMEVKEDADKNPNVLLLKNIEMVRQVFIYYNSDRHVPEEKRLKVSERCEHIISKVLQHLPTNPVVDIPNLRVTEEIKPKFTKYYVITPLLAELKAKSINFGPDSLDDVRNVGLFGEVFMKDGSVQVEADIPKVQKLYPIIRFMNEIKKLNAEKTGTAAP